jgi:hypothetical protein
VCLETALGYLLMVQPGKVSLGAGLIDSPDWQLNSLKWQWHFMTGATQHGSKVTTVCSGQVWEKTHVFFMPRLLELSP